MNSIVPGIKDMSMLKDYKFNIELKENVHHSYF